MALPRRPIKAIILDVDGTLTDRGRRLSLDAAAALRELSDAGIPVILATGNVLPIALGLHRFLGLSGPLIAENGGLVYFSDDNIVRLAKRDIALAAYEELVKHVPVKRLFTDRWRESEVALIPDHDVKEIEPWVKHMGVTVESTGFAIHIIEKPGAGKLEAAHVALKPLNLGIGDCLVAGDGNNDVDLLKSASVGVSFPDAMDRARQAADFVTKENDGKGIVEALRHFGLWSNGSGVPESVRAMFKNNAVRRPDRKQALDS